MKKHLLLLFAGLLPLLVSAQTKVQIDGIWYNLISKAKQAEMTWGENYSGSITIPATVSYDGVEYSVTSIGKSAFRFCSSLTSITIPEGVTSIELYAFDGCTSLTSITIPKSVTKIGEYAFNDCSSLASITIPEGVTSIGYKAFSGCTNLTSITIPEGVTSIEDYTFYNCSSLASITIPKSVMSIGEGTFHDCSSLTSITIPEGVTSIEDYTFSGCTNLASITIPKSVTRIWNDVFSGCSSLASITIPEGVTDIGSYTFVGCTSLTTITIPEGVTDIGGYTFKNCTNLASITIPKGVKTIWNDAFSGCSSLTSITIPEGVTSIGTYAFLDCSSLATVVLPKNLTTIDSKAFANCSKLLNVYCYAPTVPKTKTDAFDNSYPEYTTLHVPANALNAYKTTAPWSSFGKFETFEIIVNNITLNVSTTTITQGEELKLIATVTPDDAADKSISWSSSNTSIATVDKTGKVSAIAPGTATIIAMANDGSGVKASCEVTVNELIMGKCATPVINYVDGRVVFECTTKEATIKSNFMGNNASDYSDSEVSFIPTYTITAYATKKQYENSDVATCTLCWLPCTEEHQENNNILAIPSKPVLISTQGGTITISGLDAEITVAAYNTAGTQLATAAATGGTATLVTGLASSSIAIVKIGDYTIKIAVK